MNLSPMVAEWAAVYEQENDRKPTEMVIQIAEHILKVGKMLTNLGRKDAEEGKIPYPATAFPTFVVKAFRMEVGEDHETVQVVADLWYTYYRDGYQQKEA